MLARLARQRPASSVYPVFPPRILPPVTDGSERDLKWPILAMLGILAWAIAVLLAVNSFIAHAEGTRGAGEDMLDEGYCDSLELLALCVEAEAGNQGLMGKRMVVDVILNRVDDPDWPDSIEGVITQPYAFSSYWDGGIDRVLEPSEETIRAVQMELNRRSWPGIYYFTAGGYGEYGTPWRQVGNHYFCTK